MTTIVGVQGAGWAVMAADSQVTDEDFRYVSPQTPKIIKFDELLIGVRGDARPGDIITYNWSPPEFDIDDMREWVGKRLVPSFIEAFKDNDYDYKTDSDFTFLVSARGELFEIGSDLSIVRSNYGLYAIGSGMKLAIGNLAEKDISTVELATVAAQRAIIVASLFDIHTSLPVQVEVDRRQEQND